MFQNRRDLSWILLSLGQVICFTSLSQIFVLTYSSSLAIARLHSYVKSAEPPKGDYSPTQLHNKKDTDISQYLFYMSTGGLEPPQLSPHAPQACVSTIPPHRQVFNYFVILLLNCHLANTVDAPDVVFDNPLLERYSIVLVGRVPQALCVYPIN